MVVVSAGGLVLASTTPCASSLSLGKKPEEFKNGIKAQDYKDWTTSIKLMRQALTKQPEDGERVKIYGARYPHYLPHYYLGLALFKQGDCAGALKEWTESMSIGAVRETEEGDALAHYQDECRSPVSQR